jgi:hypothetical protein
MLVVLFILDQLEAARRKGWKVRIWTTEVGCRGFPGLPTFLKDIGLVGSNKISIVWSVGHKAERASQSTVYEHGVTGRSGE